MLTGKIREVLTMRTVELSYDELRSFSKILESHRGQMHGEKVSAELLFGLRRQTVDNLKLRRMTVFDVRNSGKTTFPRLKVLSILANKYNFTIEEVTKISFKSSSKPCWSRVGLVGAIMGRQFRYDDLVFRYFISYKIIYHKDAARESKSLENLLEGKYEIYCIDWKFISFNFTHHTLRNNPFGSVTILEEQELLLNNLRIINSSQEVHTITSSSSHALIKETSSIPIFARLLAKEFRQNYYSTSKSFFST
ncbi:unnamed protein product, partial [Allacma fusca]